MASIYAQASGAVSMGGGGGTPAADAQRLVRNANLIARNFPQFADDPAMLLRLAGVPMESGALASQISQLASARIANGDIESFRSLSPESQRILWDGYTTTQRQAYTQLGYEPPNRKGDGGSSFLGDLVGTIVEPLGSAWEVASNVAEPVIGAGLGVISEIGEAPGEMYRMIRQQPEWVQALAGIVAVGGAVALTAATGGAALPGLGAIGGALGSTGALGVGASAFAGLTAGYTAAGVVSMTSGDVGYWGRTFDDKWNREGEGVFERGALVRATDLLTDDGSILDLASSLALSPEKSHGDTSPVARLLREFASRRSATSDQARTQAIEELAGRTNETVGSQKYIEAYSALEELSRQPRFMEALSHLERSKISFGRDAAEALFLPPDSALYNVVSGGADAMFLMAVDPLFAAGKMLAAERAMKFGVRAADMASFAEYGVRIDALATKSGVKRSWTRIADHLANDDVAGMVRTMPNTAGLVAPLKEWASMRKLSLSSLTTDFKWSADEVTEFFKSQAGFAAMGSGKSLAGTPHHLLMVPHMTPVQAGFLRAREEVKGLLRNLDDQNIRFRLNLPGKVGAEYEVGAKLASRGMADPELPFGSGFALQFINHVPVLKSVAESVGSFMTTMLTRVPTSGALELVHGSKGAMATEDIIAFTDLGRVFGMPSTARQHWANIILNESTPAARRNAIRTFHRTLFEDLGVGNTPEGADMIRRFMAGGDKAYTLNRPVGTWLGDAANFIAIPNIMELRKAVRQQTVLNKFLNLTDADLVNLAVTKIWKPSVLLRIGFITRAVGDEMISWLARDGLYGVVASTLGRAQAKQGEVVGHAKFVAGLHKVFHGGRNHVLTKFGKPAEEFAPKMLLAYSDHVRSFYRNGLLGSRLDKIQGQAGRITRAVLTPDHRLRTLALNGLPEYYVRAGNIWWSHPLIRDAAMKQVSASKAGVAHDIASPDPIADNALYRGDGWMDVELMEQLRLSNEWEEVDPTSSRYDFFAWNNQNRIFETDGVVDDDRLLHPLLQHVGPHELEQFARAGYPVEDLQPVLDDVTEIVKGLDEWDAHIFSAAMLKNDPDYVLAVAGKRQDELAKRIQAEEAAAAKVDAERAAEGLAPIKRRARKVSWQENAYQDMLRHRDTRAFWVSILEDKDVPVEVRRLAQLATRVIDDGDPALRAWLATYMDVQRNSDGVRIVTDWNEASRDSIISQRLGDQIRADPAKMDTFGGLEDSTTTAKSGRRVARPAEPGQQKLYVPTPVVNGVEALGKVALGDQATLDELASVADEATQAVILRMASEFHEYPPHLVAMLQGSLHRPLWWSFRDPEQAREVTAVLNHLGGWDRPDMAAAFGELDMPADLRANELVTGYWDETHDVVRVIPELMQRARGIRPGEGLILMGGELIPGASQAEALAEHLEVKGQAWKALFHSNTDRTPGLLEGPDVVRRPRPSRDPDQPHWMPEDADYYVKGKQVSIDHLDGVITDGGDPFVILPDAENRGASVIVDPYAMEQDFNMGGPFIKGETPAPYGEAGAYEFVLDHPNTVQMADVVLEDEIIHQASGQMAPGHQILEGDPGPMGRGEQWEEFLEEGTHTVYVYPDTELAFDTQIALMDEGIRVIRVVEPADYEATLANVLDFNVRLDTRATQSYVDPLAREVVVPMAYGPGNTPVFKIAPPPGVSSRTITDHMDQVEIAHYIRARALASQRIYGRQLGDDVRLHTDKLIEDMVDQMIGLPWGRTARIEAGVTRESMEFSTALNSLNIQGDQILQHLSPSATSDDFVAGTAEGSARYREMLTDYVALRAGGATPQEGVVAALRRIGFELPSDLTAPTSRVLWETFGPLALEKRWAKRYGPTLNPEGLPVKLADPNDMRMVPRPDLPRHVVRPRYKVPDAPGWWDKMVQFGFGKVIGPMIDKLMRTPFAFNNFVHAYRDVESRHAWLRDPRYFAPPAADRIIDVYASSLRRPWQPGEHALLSGLSSSHGTGELGNLLTLSKSEPWFTIYGHPSQWLRTHYDQAYTMAVETGNQTLLDVLDNVEITTTRARQAMAGLPQMEGEGSFHRAVRDTLAQSGGAFKRMTGTKASALEADMVADGIITPGETYITGIGRLRADADAFMFEMSPERWRRKYQRWASTPPSTVEKGMEELLDAGDNLPLWAREVFQAEPWKMEVLGHARASAARTQEHATNLAIERTIVDTLPYIDRDNVRSQWQQYVRNIFPFWFAEDQFLRRTLKTVINNPEAIRKAQLVYQGLKSGGVIQQDEYGQDVFVYPGSTVLAEVIGKLPWLNDAAPIASAMTGQVLYSLPGLDRFAVPQVSPLISLPMSQITAMFPEMAPMHEALSGQRGAGLGIIRSIVPTSVMRFYDALMSNDGDRKLASAMMSALAVMEANGHGLPDNATVEEVEHHLDRARQNARIILLSQAITGFTGPASPQARFVGTPGQPGRSGNAWDWGNLVGTSAIDVMLNDEYIDMVQNLGAEEGTLAFLARYPDATPEDLFNSNLVYKIGKSTSIAGAPIPPTQAANEWLNANRDYVEANPHAAAWMVPPAQTQEEAEQRDTATWMEQITLGLRVNKAPDEFLRDIKFGVASERYFSVREEMQKAIDESTDAERRADMNVQMSLWTTAYLSTHPIFAEELQSSEGRIRRAKVLAGLRMALPDPQAPKAWHLPYLQQMIENFDEYQSAKAELTGKRDQRSIRKREDLQGMFVSWADEWVTLHPELRTFWLGIIRPEADLS